MKISYGAGENKKKLKNSTTSLMELFHLHRAIYVTNGYHTLWTGRVRTMSELIISLQKFSHITRKVGPQVQKRINALKIGQKMQDLPEELWHDSFRYYVKEDPNRNGGPNLRIIRLDPRKPSLTVTVFIFNKFVHPVE